MLHFGRTKDPHLEVHVVYMWRIPTKVVSLVTGQVKHILTGRRFCVGFCVCRFRHVWYDCYQSKTLEKEGDKIMIRQIVLHIEVCPSRY